MTVTNHYSEATSMRAMQRLTTTERQPEPMKDTVEQLATRVSTGNQNDHATISAYIEELDAIEPRFSSGMLGLLDQMGIGFRLAEMNLTVSIMQGMRMGHPDPSLPMEFAAQAVMTHSLSSMSHSAKYECGKGDQQIRRSHPDAAPDILGSNLDAINRYYQSLATAIMALDAAMTDESYQSAITNFIAWAGTQENFESVLACALEHKTIDTGYLQAILALQSETATALQTGAI